MGFCKLQNSLAMPIIEYHIIFTFDYLKYGARLKK